MNVLTNLMAMLSPGAAAKGAGGQAAGDGGDFSALFAQMGQPNATATSPIALSIPATMPASGPVVDPTAANGVAGAALPMPVSPLAALAALAGTADDLKTTMPTEDAPAPAAPTEQMLQAAIPLAVKGAPLRAKPGVEAEDMPAESDGEAEAEAGESADANASKPKAQAEIPVSAPTLATPAQAASAAVTTATSAPSRRSADGIAAASSLQAPAPPAVSIQPRTPAAAGEHPSAQAAPIMTMAASTAIVSSPENGSVPPNPQALPSAPQVSMPSPARASAPAATGEPIAAPIQPQRAVQEAAPIAQPSFAADAVRAVMGAPRAVASPATSPIKNADPAQTGDITGESEPLAPAMALLQMVTGAPAQPGKAPQAAQKLALGSSIADGAPLARPTIARGATPSAPVEPSIDKGTDKAAPTMDVAASLGASAVASPRAVAATPTAPVADLSASLNQQVIDLSSGGQWVDGLAREIASMAAGTGEGSFRLSPPNLGPMHVAISRGDAGMAIKLTVETTAAETALKQDSSQLKADAQLSALRISDVQVERVHRVHEPSATDSSSQGNAGQNSSGQNSQSAFSQQGNWGGGQAQTALSQGQGQSGGQQGRKAFSDGAVSSQGDMRDQGVEAGREDQPRARYA